MTRFYNPYQFIPLAKPKQLVEYERINKGEKTFIRHDRWDENARSGRIVCRLETISPLVIGARQEEAGENEPKRVIPYRGGQALPANALRGMIASVAESISNSALRVLSKWGEHEYSVRKSPCSALKKIGLLLKEDNGWILKPLPDFFSVNCRSVGGKKSYRHNCENNIYTFNNGQFIYFIRGRHKDMPNKRKEYALEWNQMRQALNNEKPIPVETKAVEDLNRELARGFEENPEFPYLPVGYGGSGRNSKNGFVRAGDLVYYRINNNKVVEISYSAIWRRSVGNLYDALKGIDENLLPWNSERDNLTPAEALFGVIEKGPDGGGMAEDARNLASRLRFHDAEAESAVDLAEEILLKILASPKPPSPSLYFRTADSGYVSKQELDLAKHKPNGRKRYLPQPDWNEQQNGKWGTQHPEENRKQKLCCRPIPGKTTYWFHIDFENLSEEELDLLRRAIAPAPEFQHQLGLGKPLGLGQVRVEEMGVFLIDRKARYSLAGLEQARYAEAWCSGDLVERYAVEQQVEGTNKKKMSFPEQNPLIDDDALRILVQIGNPRYLETDTSVCYPFHSSQELCEEREGYKWFVKNDGANSSQHLQPVQKDKKLPTLDSDTQGWQPHEPGKVVANVITLRLGGIHNQNQRTYDDTSVEMAIESHWPGTRVIEVKLSNSHVELVPSEGFPLPDGGEWRQTFPVGNEQNLTLTLPG